MAAGCVRSAIYDSYLASSNWPRHLPPTPGDAAVKTCSELWPDCTSVATLSQHQQPLTARQPVRAMRAPGSNFPTQIRPVKISVPGKVQEILFLSDFGKFRFKFLKIDF